MCPAFQPNAAPEAPAVPDDEANEELEEFPLDGEDWRVDLPRSDPNQPEMPELKGSDAQCFQMMSQLQARERADQVSWDDIAAGTADLNDHDVVRAQRLGSCKSGPPGEELDEEVWRLVTDPSENQEKVENDEADADVLTLHDVFRKVRLGDSDLLNVSAITPLVWKCLRNLREGSDMYALPNARKFRTGHQGRRLNWHQAAEKETATIRAICGHPAKRTSRAAAWRAVAAAMRQSVGGSDKASVSNRKGDITLSWIIWFDRVHEISHGGV